MDNTYSEPNSQSNQDEFECDLVLDFESDFFTSKEINLERLKLIDLQKEKKAELYKQIRENKKQKTKEKRLKTKQEKKNKIKQMAKEDRKKYYEELDIQKKTQLNNLISSLASEYKIIFDLDYTNLMKSREIKSLTTQIAYSYGLNKYGAASFSFHLCGCVDEIRKELFAMGAKHWYVKIYEESFYMVDDIISSGKEMIYLSPDSNDILETVNKDTFYIVGGFVDKPVSKYRSLEKALGLNIKTARLPLSEHVENLSNPVLNVNTVIEILGNFIKTNDWKESIDQALPKRMMDPEKVSKVNTESEDKFTSVNDNNNGS